MTITSDTGHTVPLSDNTKTDAMCAVLAQNWWAVAVRGVLGILFGLIALFLPGTTMLSLVLLFSAYMLVDGVATIVAAMRAARHGERWGLLVLEGLVTIAVGVIAFVLPGLTLFTFVLLVAAWALVSGGLMVAAAFRLKKDHGRGWLAFGGIVSILYGTALVMAPLIGAVVLTWWLGAYALVFGIVLLVAAVKLRARRGDGPAAAAGVEQVVHTDGDAARTVLKARQDAVDDIRAGRPARYS